MSGNLTLIKNTSEQGVIDAALEIAKRRRNTLLALKVAIREHKDLAEADQLITELVPDDEARDRIDPGQHRVAGRRR